MGGWWFAPADLPIAHLAIPLPPVWIWVPPNLNHFNPVLGGYVGEEGRRRTAATKTGGRLDSRPHIARRAFGATSVSLLEHRAPPFLRILHSCNKSAQIPFPAAASILDRQAGGACHGLVLRRRGGDGRE